MEKLFDCLGEASDYWFSCDELLFISILAGVSVRIFEAHAENLILWNEHYVLEGRPVCVKVSNDRLSGPVRGHFERLVLVTDLQIARNDPVQKRKDAANPSTESSNDMRGETPSVEKNEISSGTDVARVSEDRERSQRADSSTAQADTDVKACNVRCY